MVAKFATRQLEDTLYLKTKDIGLRIINAENGNVLKRIINELKENRIIFIECDEIQEWRPSKKDRIWFLRKLIGIDRTIDVIKRRTGAEVVFGLLHRFDLKRYGLIMESYHEMFSRSGNSAASAGEIILKYLEEYIYYYPEEWYQWKNYADIKTPTTTSTETKEKMPAPFARPVFGKA